MEKAGNLSLGWLGPIVVLIMITLSIGYGIEWAQNAAVFMNAIYFILIFPVAFVLGVTTFLLKSQDSRKHISVEDKNQLLKTIDGILSNADFFSQTRRVIVLTIYSSIVVLSVYTGWFFSATVWLLWIVSHFWMIHILKGLQVEVSNDIVHEI